MNNPNPHLLTTHPTGAAVILLFEAYRALEDRDGSINGGDAVDLLNRFFTDQGLDLEEPRTCEGGGECEKPVALIVAPKDGYDWPFTHERKGYCYRHFTTTDFGEKLAATNRPFQVVIPALRGLAANARKTIQRAQSA